MPLFVPEEFSFVKQVIGFHSFQYGVRFFPQLLSKPWMPSLKVVDHTVPIAVRGVGNIVKKLPEEGLNRMLKTDGVETLAQSQTSRPWGGGKGGWRRLGPLIRK